MNNISDEIKSALLERGASLVGFADLSELPESARHSMRFAVSMAVALDPHIIAAIHDGPTKEYHAEYRQANALLWELAKFAAGMIEDSGYRAIPKRPTHAGIDQGTQSTILPHKTVATRAGLGWIGKCALLITEEYGPAIRLTTILTDAELNAAEPIVESRCGECRLCVDSCPGRAPSGRNWNSHLARHEFYDAFACAKAARERATAKIGIDDTICGICISVCPFTAKYVKSATKARSKE
jgi:epoxyqueuosine reductase